MYLTWDSICIGVPDISIENGDGFATGLKDSTLLAVRGSSEAVNGDILFELNPDNSNELELGLKGNLSDLEVSPQLTTANWLKLDSFGEDVITLKNKDL